MKNIKGFTLIELIIVIAIIAVLSTLGLSTYNSVQQEARNSKRKADLKEIKAALESYKLENNNQYPTTSDRWQAICTTSWASSIDCLALGSAYIPGLAPAYIDQLPLDPRQNKVNTSSAYANCTSDSNRSTYLYRSNGTYYKILAMCGPEGTMSTNDSFYDPCRPTWAWQISSDPYVKGVTGVVCDGATTGW